MAPGPGIDCPKTAPSLNYTWGEWRHGINLIGVDGFALHKMPQGSGHTDRPTKIDVTGLCRGTGVEVQGPPETVSEANPVRNASIFNLTTICYTSAMLAGRRTPLPPPGIKMTPEIHSATPPQKSH